MKKVGNHNIHDAPVAGDNNKISECTPPPYSQICQQGGLSELQASTTKLLNDGYRWGAGECKLKVNRHKLDEQTWQLTVVNPRTRKTILQAEGHGDTVFAHEDNLALMAEMLMAQELTIRTEFDD